MEIKNKIYSIGGAILIGAAGLGVGFLLDNPDVIVETKTVEVEKEVFVEVPVEVIVEKIVEVETIVEVDNGNMQWAFDRMEDKSIIDDANEILTELRAEDKAFSMALTALEDETELFDVLEDANLVEDEAEVELIRVYSDFEDVTVLNSDFDDSEYSFDIRLKIEDLDAEEKSYVIATVSIEDGEAIIESVRLE